MPIIQDTLIQAGLDPSSASIYIYLAENGEQGVPAIMVATSLSRAGAYDALNLMVAQGYVEYRKTGRNAYYKAAHPTKLLGLAEERQRETALLTKEMEGVVTQLTGAFNLGNAKPGVRFFEGQAGLKQALWDSLNTKDTIYTTTNATFSTPFAEELNKEYVAERLRRKVKKKILVFGSDNTPSAPPDQITETKKMSQPLAHDIAVEVYDDTISYLTVTKDTAVAFLIKNPAIAAYHRAVFEALWKQAQY